MFLRDPDRDLDAWTADQRILEEIRTDSNFRDKDDYLCLLACNNVSAEEMEKILVDGDVVFSRSSPRTDPRMYVVEGENAAKETVEARFELWPRGPKLIRLSRNNSALLCDCLDD